MSFNLFLVNPRSRMSELDIGPFFIGVDVGTRGVRAALVSANGKLISKATNPIKVYEPQTDYYEQSSDDIWLATCKVVRVSKS